MRNSLILIFLLLLLFANVNAQNFDTLTLRINFISIQKADGSGNFELEDSLQMDYLNKSVERLNEFYAFKHKLLPDEDCEVQHSLKDSGIRFKLNRIVEIKNDSLWDNDQDKNYARCPDRKRWYLLSLQKELDSLIPDAEKGINIYLTVSKTELEKSTALKDTIIEEFSQIACSMFPSKNTNDFSVLHYPNAYIKYLFMQQFPYEWAHGTFGRGLAHELGHSLGLSHVKSCNNIMDGAGSTKRKNLTDDQVEKARNNIINTNLKKYLEE